MRKVSPVLPVVLGAVCGISSPAAIDRCGRLADGFEKVARSRDRWLPTSDDQGYIESLMQPELTPGDFAGWIAPPSRGIQGKPTDFEYVKLP